jgi:hypothetical protein
MARINLSEVNQYIKNFFERISLRDLERIHADRIKQWLIENLSNIGRYSIRDFERFGTLNSFGKHPYNDMRPVHFDRADGWSTLTEEVPDIDHLTYGTGMLYVHGEMELPEYWKDYGGKPGDHMYEDEFHHVNYSGTQKHLFQRVTGETYSFWYEPKATRPPNGVFPTWGDSGPLFGYHSAHAPLVPPFIVGGSFKDPGGTVPVYSDKVAWFYGTITYTIGGDMVGECQGDAADADNDGLIYHLDNERNNYPWRIINGATAQSVKNMLERSPLVEGSNGMYDGSVPAIASEIGTWPPTVGLRFVKDGVDGLVNFISPVNEVPESGARK